MKAKSPSRLGRRGERFVAKLLFQFRVVRSKPAARRLCEERMVLFRARSQTAAVSEARRRGKAAQHSYKNVLGEPVHFEFVGILDLLELGGECERDEVWYRLVERLRPLERRRKLLPTEASLHAGQRTRA